MQRKSTQELIQYIQESDYTEIIFDFDATLAHLIVDWQPFHKDIEDLAKKLWVLKELANLNGHKFAEFILDKYGQGAKVAIDQICAKNEKEHLQDIVYNDILWEFIQEHHKNYTFHILSNNVNETLVSALWNKQKYFTHVYGRNRVEFSKPHPEGIYTIMNLQNTPNNHFLMVWDNPHSDGEAAKRADIDYFLIDMYL